jgi:pyruvate/2-oxoglutarate dehydrogenase complex dihydrolipoamide dehydrogenase (E3) component
MRRSYDFVVIGGGSAGFNAARIAASLGKRVAVVDGAKKLGGLCILKGCMPSKTLLYSAEVLHLARMAKDFGVEVGNACADMPEMHRRKKRIIAEFAQDRAKQLISGKFDLIRGTARFVDSHTIETDKGCRIRGRHFLIGTGSKVSVPPVPGLANAKFWTSDDVLELDFNPKSVIVLGGGIVACELSQFLVRIGTKVCLIQRGPHLLKGHGPDAAAVVEQAFKDEGIEVHTHTKILGISIGAKGASVTFRQGKKTLRRTGAYLFNALGREPNTSGLGLDAIGVKTEPNGRILVNRWQQSSVSHIYAAGDCCGPHEIVHLAIQQGELAARHAARFRRLRPINKSLLLSVVFTDPQVGTIGLSEEELRQKGVKFLTASYPFDDHGKSILMGAKYGYVKVFADARKGRILGAEIVGKDGGELIHCFSTALAMGATVCDMLRAPWYHPTLSEILTYPLEEIADKLPLRGRAKETIWAFKH